MQAGRDLNVCLFTYNVVWTHLMQGEMAREYMRQGHWSPDLGTA